jgi:hypothetical protein
MKKIIGAFLAVIIVIAGGFTGWLLLGRDPMSFAAGSTVALEDYKGGAVTGVPTELASADLVKRGAYLIHAADCQACHTVPGGAPFAGGLATCHSAPSIPPTSHRTGKPASAATRTPSSWRPCATASVPMARDCIPRCPTHPTP